MKGVVIVSPFIVRDFTIQVGEMSDDGYYPVTIVTTYKGFEQWNPFQGIRREVCRHIWGVDTPSSILGYPNPVCAWGTTKAPNLRERSSNLRGGAVEKEEVKYVFRYKLGGAKAGGGCQHEHYP